MRIVCSGGGTGGHIFPAVAVAKEITKRYPFAEVLFIGAEGKMEMEKVPKAGFLIRGLWIRGLQRRLTYKNLIWPWQVITSVMNARRILKEFRPDVVAGFGGYASGAALWAASQMGIPTLIQEQNSYAGITNKILSKRVDRVCVAYEEAKKFFPKVSTTMTGNPVRNLAIDSLTSSEAKRLMQVDSECKMVLFIGGSLGAKSINSALRSLHEQIKEMDSVQFVWQCGQLYFDEYSTCETAVLENVQILEFIEDMDVAYQAADLVVCRAGALTISEIQVLGKPAILIPSPNVAEDHQSKNAKALVDKEAAILIEDDRIEEFLLDTLKEVLSSSERLKRLADNAKKLALPNATRDIVNELEKLIKEQ